MKCYLWDVLMRRDWWDVLMRRDGWDVVDAMLSIWCCWWDGLMRWWQDVVDEIVSSKSDLINTIFGLRSKKPQFQGI